MATESPGHSSNRPPCNRGRRRTLTRQERWRPTGSRPTGPDRPGNDLHRSLDLSGGRCRDGRPEYGWHTPSILRPGKLKGRNATHLGGEVTGEWDLISARGCPSRPVVSMR